MIGQWLRTVPQAQAPAHLHQVQHRHVRRDFAGQVERSVADSLQRLGLASVPVLILHSRIVGETSAGRDNRSLSAQEVLGAGGIADIMDKLRAKGLCDWIGLDRLGRSARPCIR